MSAVVQHTAGIWMFDRPIDMCIADSCHVFVYTTTNNTAALLLLSAALNSKWVLNLQYEMRTSKFINSNMRRLQESYTNLYAM